MYTILYEDDSFLCINKPPGVVVNRAQSVKTETVQDWAASYLHLPVAAVSTPPSVVQQNPLTEPVYDIAQEFLSRSGIVHRIDKETSGILLIAKTSQAFGNLKQQFMERTVKKTYQAIIHDRLPSQEGEINAPIDRLPWNKELFGIVPNGKPSQTLYKVLATYEKKTKKGREYYQLVACYPKTGRTHQIRVHLKYLNRPIVGDYLYAGRKTARDDRTWVPRVMLHAYEIECTHPTLAESCVITAPLPEDMQEVIKKLQV
jgi:23S rRNA pseudouridine1911/1915/1917 synthase